MSSASMDILGHPNKTLHLNNNNTCYPTFDAIRRVDCYIFFDEQTPLNPDDDDDINEICPQVFPHDREFKDVAIEAGEVMWKIRMLEKPRLADGASGNAYAFLTLYRITGDTIYEVRAKAFGLAATTCLWSDLDKPVNSRIPETFYHVIPESLTAVAVRSLNV
ncbi:LanC-like protein GCL1 [Tanacetum coccineum]